MRIAMDALPAAMVLGTLLGCERAESDSPSVASRRVEGSTSPAVSALPAASAAPAGSASAAPARTADASDYELIRACCDALRSAAADAPKGDAKGAKGAPPQSKYTIAAAVCSGIARQVKKGGSDPASARSLVRAQLQGVAIPTGC